MRSGAELTVPHNRWDLLVAPASRCRAPTVTVVIPYFEAQAQLNLVLAGLAQQTHPCERMEVVVVDDGSRDPPCIQARGPLRVRSLRQEDMGFRAGAARNRGAAAAGGEVLVFVDGDTVPEPHFVQRLVALPAVCPDAVTVGRRRHADLGVMSPGQVASFLRGDAGAPRPVELAEPEWLADGYRSTADLLHADDRSFRYVISAVLACRRSFFDELGGFDETFVDYGGEDWELAYRAFNNGAVLAHVRDAVAWHDGPEWAQRRGPDERRRDKRAENARLARVVPEPSMRPGGGMFDFSDVVVRLGGHDAVAAEACIPQILRAAPDTTVHLPPDAGPAFAGIDPRVVAGAPSPAALLRCRTVVDMPGPVAVDGQGFARAVDAVRPGGPGRLRLGLHDGGEVVVTATRAAGRARRWSARTACAADDVLTRLFGEAHAAASTFGIGSRREGRS